MSLVNDVDPTYLERSDALFDPPIDQLTEIVMQALEETTALISSIVSFHLNSKEALRSKSNVTLVVDGVVVSQYQPLLDRLSNILETLHLRSTVVSTESVSPFSGDSFQRIVELYRCVYVSMMHFILTRAHRRD